MYKRQGLFIAFIGLLNSGLIVPSPATTLALGNLHAHSTQLAIFGILLIAVLQAYRVKASMLIGVLATLAAGILFHQVKYCLLYTSRMLLQTQPSMMLKQSSNIANRFAQPSVIHADDERKHPPGNGR